MSNIETEIEKYDRAVFDYLSTISGKIVYAPTSMAVRTITKREKFKDDKPWSFLSFYRSPTFEVNWDRMNNPATIYGELTRFTINSDSDRVAQYTQYIPVNLSYSIEIWASRAVEVQSLAISLMTKIFMQEQVLKVDLGEGDPARFHILDVSWNDNSDLERETDIGKIYRHTISFTIDARLNLVTELNTTRFCCVPVNIYEEIPLELNCKGGERRDDNQESNI